MLYNSDVNIRQDGSCGVPGLEERKAIAIIAIALLMMMIIIVILIA